MNRHLVMLLSAGALLFAGCANDLTVQDTENRPPAPDAPDPITHLPADNSNTMRTGGPGGY